MKKLFCCLGLGILVVIIAVGVMFVFKVCPPTGPWPMPPWCRVVKIIAPDFKNLNVGENFQTGLNKDFIFGVNMMDTWGKNYNFLMFENTRNNIESSFVRVANTGATEVYVHDFYMAEYVNDGEFSLSNLDYKFVPEIFGNDMRDEVMTDDDLNKLAKTAHEQNLKIGWRLNLHFVDIGKYLKKLGAISADVEKDRKLFDEDKSEAWVNNFFVQYENLLVNRARVLKTAGFDYMWITPSFMNPKFHPYEELANEKWKDLIIKIKTEFGGQVGVIMDPYGFVDGNNNQEDWTKYDFYKTADLVNFPVYNLLEKYRTDQTDLKSAWEKYFSFLNNKAKQENIKLGIGFYCFSFSEAATENIPEFNDILNPKIKSLTRDDQYQADCYEAVLEALRGKENINRFIAGNYWWDDAMDPETAKTRVSISPSIRNKTAETVFAKWAWAK